MTIWLAIVTHNTTKDYAEYHIRWDGHSSVESANKEILEIRNRLIKDAKLPLDCYVYEAEVPLYGNRAYNLDDIDFNFYRELTQEEKAEKQQRIKEIESKLNVSLT